MEHKGSAPVHKRAPATCAHDALNATPVASQRGLHTRALRDDSPVRPAHAEPRASFRHPRAARGIHLTGECRRMPVRFVPLVRLLLSVLFLNLTDPPVEFRSRAGAIARNLREIKATTLDPFHAPSLSGDRR